MVNFVIIALQRSGTVFFESILNSHPQIQCYGEILHSRETEEKLDYFYRYWLDRVKEDGANITFRGMIKNFNSYLGHIFTNISGKKAFGIDIKYDHYHRIPNIHKYLNKHRVRTIHLIRRNVLKTLISKKLNYRKKELGRRSHGMREISPATIFIDKPQVFIKQLDRRVGEIEEFQRILPKQYDYLEIFYEDFFQEIDNSSGMLSPIVLDQIYDFLEIEDKRYDLITDLKKTNPNDLCDIIENYDEIAEILEKTPWKHFLD